MQITVVRIWLLSPYPRTHKEPCLGGCQSSRTPSNDDEVVVIGFREILGAIHFHCILKSAFLRSLKKKNNGREKQCNSKAAMSEKFCERTLLWRKTEGTSKGETQFVTSQHTMGNVHPFLNGDQLPALWWDCPHAPSMWQTATVTGLQSTRNYGPDGPKELTYTWAKFKFDQLFFS